VLKKEIKNFSRELAERQTIEPKANKNGRSEPTVPRIMISERGYLCEKPCTRGIDEVVPIPML